jgi:hypothetical protein
MIVDRLLNAAALLLLRTCRPLEAHRVLGRIGRVLPVRTTRDELSRAAAGLGASGTCLSRSLALAARAPSAEVVLGVHPQANGGFMAHAWVEIDGQPLRGDDPAGREIARFGRSA